MSRVTTAFQSLSQEVLQLVGTFCEAGLPEVVRILEDLQKREKEKLDSTVKWQILVQREKDGGECEVQNGASEDGGSVNEEEKRKLRRRYVG